MKKYFTLILFVLFQFLGLQAQTYFGKPNILAEEISDPRLVLACDIDDDGDLDILSALYTDGKITWSRNTDGNGSFTAPQVISDITYDVVTVYASDIDGDGDQDAVVTAGSSIFWFRNTGPVFSPQVKTYLRFSIFQTGRILLI